MTSQSRSTNQPFGLTELTQPSLLHHPSLCVPLHGIPLTPTSAFTYSSHLSSTIVTSDAFDTLAYAAVDSLPANYTGTTWDEIEDVYGQIYDAASANIEEPSTNLTAQIAYEDNEVRATYVGLMKRRGN